MDDNIGHKVSILVTGGAGYVGSHSVLLLLNDGYDVVVVDNCQDAASLNSKNKIACKPESLKRVEELSGRSLYFYNYDLVKANREDLKGIFMTHNIKVVIHFAALKSVTDSIISPLRYYTNNLVGTLNLLNVMREIGCKNLIFSSSATIYGPPLYLPVDEKHQTGLDISNPYGRTKYMIEEILKDLSNSPTYDIQKWNIISLRYFNPIGAHPSGYIGEHVRDSANNLMPYISQVSIGRKDKLYVYGKDFATKDGTGARDFIHVMDLASGHVQAVKSILGERNINKKDTSNFRAYNLGTGNSYTVLEVIETFEKVNGVKIPYEITERRQGDMGEVYADPGLALEHLGWSAKYNLEEMCRDTYKWQYNNPLGYTTHTNANTKP